MSFIQSFIDWLIESSFCSESLKHCLSQTVRAGKLNSWENVHPPLCVTCPMSFDMCHKSGVRCQVTSVKSHIKKITSCGASWGRVCYQWEFPCLVFFTIHYLILKNCHILCTFGVKLIFFKNLSCKVGAKLHLCMCHVSCVMCHVSCVVCQVSGVRC